MTFFLIGGYSRDGGGEAAGIGLLGDDGFLGPVAPAASPSWIEVRGRRLYAVEESGNSIRSWAFDGASLDEGVQVDAGGEIPCHLTVLPDALLVSCYGNGVLTRVPLDADGAPSGPGEVVLRGDGPHPDQGGSRIHATLLRPDGTVLVADLGADAVHVLAPDLSSTHRWALPAGTGPRDLALLDDGRVLVLGELSCHLLVLDADGTVRGDAPLPGAQEGDHAAALALAPRDGGVRVYTGLRGSNRIAVLDVGASGAPVPVTSAPSKGEWPRHLVVDGDAVRVANQQSSSVTVLDAETLELVEAPEAVPSPARILPVPDEWVALIR